MTGFKRSLEESSLDGDEHSPRDSSTSAAATAATASSAVTKPASPSTTISSANSNNSSASSFRNVSACNRCRLRKNRCDTRLPACLSCEKANVKCVGYDPITKREIPRSYVYYLESRIAYLESLLKDNSITFTPPENFTLSYNPTSTATNPPKASITSGGGSITAATANAGSRAGATATRNRNGSNAATAATTTTSAGKEGAAAAAGSKERQEQYDREKLTKLVSNIGMVSVQGASDPRYLGSTSGISFARVVFAAVKSTVSGASSERGSVRGAKSLTGAATGVNGTSMRDSFFGLQTKPTIRQAPFPDRELGLKLVELYFEHANPQIPTLHRGEFMEMFERAYASDEKRTARELYMLNIVFAIGAGIIVGGSDTDDSPKSTQSSSPEAHFSPQSKRRRLMGHQYQPEEYHASAIVHLESFLGSSPAADRPDGFGGGLEELQAVLLLAGFALLRPVAPGLWYIVGVAVRLGVDLGLHYEDGVGIDGVPTVDDPLDSSSSSNGGGNKDTTTDHSGAIANGTKVDAKERGRRQWVRDLRRRLWWCIYSFDRLVSTCVGRPFGITDQVVTTEFPSLLDDRYITKEGFLVPSGGSEKPSYKVVAHHYFRLRLLQSEILQVLQHRQAQQARASGANQSNEYMHTNLPSPFLARFDSFRSWRRDIDHRLWEWIDCAPNQLQTGVQFSPLFLELNYWQAVIMLYRQSLSVPSVLADELGSTNDDVSSPSIVNIEEREDEEQVFLKVAEAGQKVLKLYRQLHRVHLVNYTYLATHHLFMAGISFLYAVWHSPVVRSHLTLDDFDFTVLAATSVLGDLVDKCPPAEACRDAFDRMSKATIQMCMSSTGFGPQALKAVDTSTKTSSQSPSTKPVEIKKSPSETDTPVAKYQQPGYFPPPPPFRRPAPRFDMNLRDLFSDDETKLHSLNRISNHVTASMRPPQIMPPHIKQEAFNSSPLNTGLTSPFTQPQQSPFMMPQQRAPTTIGLDHSPIRTTAMQQQQQQHHSGPYAALPNQTQFNTFVPVSSSMQNNFGDINVFPDLDFHDPSFPFGPSHPTVTGSSDTGVSGSLDLGFGIGLDSGNHDWSEGSGFDLFDGFFFGGGSGAGGL